MSGPRRGASGWTNGWTGPALVAALAAAAFLPSLSGRFVWDDPRFLAENPNVTRPDSWLRFLTDASTVDDLKVSGIVRPLRTLEFAADWRLFGADPVGFHVHSILWHVLASALMVLILRRLLVDGRAAVVAGLLWAVHPSQTESVAWISSRGDVAMGAMALASILFALKAEGFDRCLAVSLAAAAVAPMYKEPAVALPVVILALRWTRLSRAPVWPYVAVAATYLLYRRAVQLGPTDHGFPFMLGGSTAGTFATMFRAFGFYVVECVLPAQAVDWYMSDSTSFIDFAALAWLAVHAAILGSAVFLRRRAPLWTVSVAWFYAFFLTVANWPVCLGLAAAERFMYLSLGGFALAVGWALTRVPRATWPALVVAAAFGVGSAARTQMWRNDDALWEAVLSDHESTRARASRARALHREGIGLRDLAARMPEGEERTQTLSRVKSRLEELLEHAHRGIAQRCDVEMTDRPTTGVARSVETIASSDCYLLGRYAEALFHAEEAVRINEALDGVAQYDRAMSLVALGYGPQAMAAMRRARDLKFRANDLEIGNFLLRAAKSCEERGLPASARAACEEAVTLLPDDALRRDAQTWLDAAPSNPRTQRVDEEERGAIVRLDQELARVPRTCPAPRRRPRAK